VSQGHIPEDFNLQAFNTYLLLCHTYKWTLVLYIM